MITFLNATLRLGGRSIFEKLEWRIPKGARIGLVGDNGAGKTSLLRILTGETLLDEGSVEREGTLRIGYLPQDLAPLESDLIPLDYLRLESGWEEERRRVEGLEESLEEAGEEATSELLKRYKEAVERFHHRGGWSFEGEIRRVLKGRGFRERHLNRSCKNLSGGWKMRVHLALLLLKDPDLLLLDEPTNHLDTETLEWLESFLQKSKSALLVVSHDQTFLDRTVKAIAELRNGRITIFKGGYSVYLKEKELRREQAERDRRLREGKERELQKFVERFRYKATKAAQVQSRLKLQAREEVNEEEESSRRVRFRFPPSSRSAREVLRLDNVGHGYDQAFLFRHLSLTLFRGERVALLGVNGSGKSTMGRLLAGKEIPLEGSVERGQGVKIAQYCQESLQNLDYRSTLWQEVDKIGEGWDDQRKRDLLGTFLFGGEDLEKRVEVLSGGEKSRLALVKVLLTNSNCLILDEPTNHLDGPTRRVLEEALLSYEGTLILISHDRTFLDRLAQRVFEIREGEVREYRGNYSDYRKARERELSGDETERGASVALSGGEDASKPKSREKKKEEAERRRLLYPVKRELKESLKELEAEIRRREEEKGEAERLLCDPEVLRSPERIKELGRLYKRTKEELPLLYDRWEELMERWESIVL